MSVFISALPVTRCYTFVVRDLLLLCSTWAEVPHFGRTAAFEDKPLFQILHPHKVTKLPHVSPQPLSIFYILGTHIWDKVNRALKKFWKIY
jgi:hypothetical protein